ncbi:MAG: hypothetical protein ABL907_04860 [Hyphomicrobium sp.]
MANIEPQELDASSINCTQGISHEKQIVCRRRDRFIGELDAISMPPHLIATP